jgi:hypothetical protein
MVDGGVRLKTFNAKSKEVNKYKSTVLKTTLLEIFRKSKVLLL